MDSFKMATPLARTSSVEPAKFKVCKPTYNIVLYLPYTIHKCNATTPYNSIIDHIKCLDVSTKQSDMAKYF